MRPADVALANYDGSGLYSDELNERLWMEIPEGLRSIRLTARTIPEEYRASFFVQKDGAIAIDLRGLPEPLAREVAFGLWRVIESGGKVLYEQFRVLNNCLRGVMKTPSAAGRRSLMDATLATWQRDLFAFEARRTGRPLTKQRKQLIGHALRRVYRYVVFAYDQRPWWQHELWSLELDPRIPRRAREPMGRACLYFDRFQTGWLKRGLQWFLYQQLAGGQITWSTARSYFNGLIRFDAFLAPRGVPGPWLCDEPLDVRPLMLDYVASLRERKSDKAERAGEPLSKARMARLMTDVEQFYGLMCERREEATRALGEPGWSKLTGAHARLWHFGEKPRDKARVDEAKLIDDTAMRSVLENVELLAKPVQEGGMGDEQAMRILLLASTIGRRINEILLMDFDPLLPLGPTIDDDAAGFVAKLRYGQTKIEAAPDTIPVDADTVDIIKAQQEWVKQRARELGLTLDATSLPYLFVAHNRNQFLKRPYPSPTLHNRLREFSDRIDLRDQTGRRIWISRTHHFRHTAATDLLQRGVPLHVIQRWLGQLSPTMTMRYAQISSEAQEREFLRYRKITATGQELDIAPEDLYDLLQLDQRADRILPNGWCLLPPRQTCDRGNACLTCGKFATDATHLDDHKHQLDLLGTLIDSRTAAFQRKTGHAMPEDNVWLAERRKEQRALAEIINVLESPGYVPERAVVGPGVSARAEPDD